jgi:circadian clock protein KaiC
MSGAAEPRMPTGIAGLDHLLEGGIVRGNSFLIEGPPGSGKTTFAIRSVYEGVVQHREPALIITFEEFPKQIYQEALGYGVDLAALEKQGMLRVVWTPPQRILEGFTGKNDLIDKIIGELSIKRLVIDSITHFKRISAAEVQLRELLAGILNYLKLKRINSFLIKELERIDDQTIAFEEYLVDASMRVYNATSRTGGQNVRYVEIRKTRGQAHVSGRHPFRLTQNGIHVFPDLRPQDVRVLRTEKRLERRRVATGVSGVDAMLEGGFWKSSLNIVGGAPGTGKSVFSCHFIDAGLSAREPCTIVSTSADSQRLLAQAASLGMDWKEHLESQRLTILEVLPVGISIEEAKNIVFQHLRSANPKRLVFDCIDDLWGIVRDDDRIRDFLLLLSQMVEASGTTAVVLHTLSGVANLSDARSDNTDLASCVIQLTTVESEGDLRSFFGIRKCAGTEHVKELREFYIDRQGFHVGHKPSGMSGILSGRTQGTLTDIADKVIPDLEAITKIVDELASTLGEKDAKRKQVREARSKLAKLDVLLREHFGLTEFHKLAEELLGLEGPSGSG